jgi:hypothetical protein
VDEILRQGLIAERMLMITQIVDQDLFNEKASQIRARLPILLSQWGLPPEFNRWQLTQDTETGFVVLFAVLNHEYIATHTSTLFSDYFDPRLLQDLADELHVQVVSYTSDGLRYAFILDRGQMDMLPKDMDYPFLDGDRFFVRVGDGDQPVPEMPKPSKVSSPSKAPELAGDRKQVLRGVGALLKDFDDIRFRNDGAVNLSPQGLPDGGVENEEGFNQRAAEPRPNVKGATTPGDCGDCLTNLSNSASRTTCDRDDP